MTNNSTYGLSVGSAFTNLSIVDSHFQGNGTGLYNGTAAQLVDAQGNYWGTADGSSTDGGSGDSYTGNIDASAFLTLSPPCVTPHSNLEISKSVVAPATVMAGDTITFTIEFTNTGPMAAEDLSITDLVPTTITNTQVVSSGIPVVDTNNVTNYIWSIPTLGVGQSGLIQVIGEVDPAFLGTAITNTAVITGDVVDTTPADNSSTITVTISLPNSPPTAGNDVVNINEDDGSTDISADLLLNDNDPDTDPLLFTSVGVTGTTGTVTRVSDTQVTYDPNGQFETLSAGATITDTFSYIINDGNGESATANVAVIITGENDQPTADADSFNVIEDSTSNSLDVLDGDADIDTLDTLSVSAVGAPDQGGSVTNNGTDISYSPAADFFGTEIFTYTVGDGNGGSATALVTVTVQAQNDPPLAATDNFTVTEDAAATNLDVLANDSILPDTGETLTISAVGSTDQGGTATNSGGTQISYTPAADFVGTETFTYTVGDGNGEFATATVTVLVTNQNDPPIAATDSFTVTEDAAVTNLDVLANDSILPDTGETLTISAVGATDQGGTATNSGGTQIAYTPAADFVGTETFTYTVGDGNGEFATATLTVQVTNQNDPPIAATDNFTVTEDAAATNLDVLANDSILPDTGETLAISAVGATDQGGTATNVGGTQIAYTPAADFVGTETFTYTVGDGNGEFATTTVTVQVTNQNDPPIAATDSFTVTEDAAATNLGVLANDSILPDTGETLTISAVGATDQGGTATNGGGTQISYTPAADFVGTETFTYTVGDGNGEFATTTVTVQVTNQNDPPIAATDSFTVTEDAATTNLDVLANDSILPDTGETLTISAVGATDQGGTATNGGGTQIAYTPAADFVGTESFTYTVGDGNGGSATSTVTVQVTNQNDPPIAATDSFTVTEDAAATNLDVLANDSILPDTGETLTISAVGATDQGGTATNGGGTQIAYTPAADFVGTETFTYTIDDGNGGSASATVTVLVTNTNDDPTANADSETAQEDSTNNILDVLANDSILPDTGETLTISAVGATDQGGSTSIISGTQISYTPVTNFVGTETFTYTIGDGNGGSATATVTVDVQNQNDPPIALSDTFTVTEDAVMISLDVLQNDSTLPDTGETLTISAVGATDQGGTATNSGGTQISYTPVADFVGTETFTYTIDDGNGGSASATVTVLVTNTNDDPTANADSETAQEDSTNNILDVLANDSILPDTGETLTISAVGATDQGGSTSIISGTQISYSPVTNFVGTETFTYTIGDGNGGSATATVTVDVQNQNDPPIALSDTFTVTEDAVMISLDVLQNDSTLPDTGETLTISAVGATNQGGSTSIISGTLISYSSATNFVGTETFTYTVGDGNGGSASATVTVLVSGTNDDPTANPDSETVQEDSTGNLLDVLANDSILPDTGETLTISAVGATDQGGSTSIISGTQISYSPAANFAGTETFTYTIGDGNGGSASATVTVLVNGSNDDPTANPDSETVQEDSTGNLLDVLANDSILPDTGETLTISAVSATDQGGTATNSGGTQISYTPTADFVGTETFTYTMNDGNGGSASATVTVNVQNQNDPPVALSDTFTVTEDAAMTSLDVLQNDSILPDVGETLTIIAVGNPDQNGAVSIASGVSLNYLPEPDFFGTETFTYTVNDGNGGQATAVVTITVSPTNDDPEANDDNYTIAGTDANVNLDVLTNDDITPDVGESLSLVAIGVPAGGGTAIQSGNNIVYTPLAGFASTDIFTYTISDGNGGFATATVSVAVDDDRPNLAISAISLDSTLVCQGQELLVTFSVQNPGVGDADAFAIAMYDDTAAEGFDNKIGEFNMPSFPSGTTFNFNVSYVPRSLGERHIKFFADVNDVVVESVEDNNGASEILTVLEDPAPTGSLTINGGAAFTNNPNVTLGLFGSDSGSCATSAAEMRFFYNGQATGWAPFSSSDSISFAATDNEKVTIYVQYRDENKNSSIFIGQSITYDISPPESSVTGPTGSTTNTTFDVSWNGTDLTSGIASYDIQVQDNGGPWVDWQVGTQAASESYDTAEVGHTYCFRSMATDVAGNVEPAPFGNGDTCISVIEPITGADISIARLAFNQGIQNDSNSVPMVANRPILVRLEVGLSEQVEIDGVNALLYGFRNGQPLEGSPLSAINGPITAKPNPDLLSETDLLHFQFPPSWRSGDIQIYVELDPDNVIDEASETNNRYPAQDFKTISFNQTADLEITVIPIIWNKDGETHDVTAAEIASFTDYTLRTFPLANVEIKVHSSLRHEGSEIDWLSLLYDVDAIRGAELPNPASHQIYYGLIPFPYDTYSGTAGLGFRPGSASIGFAIPGDSGGIIAAHELGHNFGRLHVGSADDGCGVPAGADPLYPYTEGVIEYTGWDFGRGQLISGDAHDFMSYCSDVWISDYTYQSIYSQIKQSSAQGRAAADLQTVLGTNSYLVSGSINNEGSSGQLESAFLLESNDTLLDNSGGDFRLVMVDENNVEIYSQSFDPIEVTEESLRTGSSKFSYLLPALDGVEGIQLYYQNSLLDEFTADSGAVDDVTISSTVPGSLTTDTLTLTWSDSSATAQYMVRFSADGGATWTLLAPPQSEKSLVIDVTTLPGTTNGLFEIVANDGLANKVVQSTLFTIEPRGPEVVILNSAEPIMLENPRSQLVLNGNGFDLEDGALESSRFTWRSNRDGELGNGRLLTVEDLSLGWHTITLEATDSSGNVGQTTMQVLVGQMIYLPAILK